MGHNLPNSLMDIVATIGQKQTLMMVSKLRGQTIYIPKHPTEDCALVAILGFADVFKLAQIMGGSQFALPVCRSRKNAIRNQKIRKDRANLTLSELAQKYELSFSQVQKICRVVKY